MITLNSIDDLTSSTIGKIIKKHKLEELPRLIKLDNYYKTKNEILKRQMTDSSKPNNKIANPYANYITDTLTGYFIGEPITYNCDDKKILQDLNMIFVYNDEADENMELAKMASIFGVAYEMLYFSDEEKIVRFKSISPKELIPIYDKTIEHNLLCAIRYYDDYDMIADKTYTIVDVITDKEIQHYRMAETATTPVLQSVEPHYFGMVPIAIYKNNEEMLGDFESVISLIDAYDAMESDSVNDFAYFVDCYLALYGFTADSEDVQAMKENRVLLMDEGTSAEWLVKDTNDTTVENMKNRLDTDIHKFSKCPNLADKEFASNASGIAIKFKTLGTENLVSIKERKFKRGLQQRLELISMISGLLNDGFDWRGIDIIFTRNLPSNDTDIANMVKTLKDIVSDETLLAQIPFVSDVQAELEKVAAQREKEKETNPFFSVGLDYNTQAMNKEDETQE